MPLLAKDLPGGIGESHRTRIRVITVTSKKTFLHLYTLVVTFRPPQDLKPSDLVDIDELLVALDANAMEKVNVKSLLSALPYLLKNRYQTPFFKETIDYLHV